MRILTAGTFRKAAGAVAVLAVVLMMESTGWSQCAMCRTALEGSPEGRAMAEGFQYGILFLLAAPYAILGSVGIGLLRAYRKKSGDSR